MVAVFNLYACRMRENNSMWLCVKHMHTPLSITRHTHCHQFKKISDGWLQTVAIFTTFNGNQRKVIYKALRDRGMDPGGQCTPLGCPVAMVSRWNGSSYWVVLVFATGSSFGWWGHRAIDISKQGGRLYCPLQQDIVARYYCCSAIPLWG